jgi:hypothetical protein
MPLVAPVTTAMRPACGTISSRVQSVMTIVLSAKYIGSKFLARQSDARAALIAAQAGDISALSANLQ